ncbi:MAG: ISKra4 family transposase, partial [Sedimentitalea sp.]
MDVGINVETTTEAGKKRKQQIISFNLPGRYHGDLGLKLEHSKTLLAQLHLAIIQHQIEEISDASLSCPCCGRTMPIHDYRTRVIDTLFGRFPVRVPR